MTESAVEETVSSGEQPGGLPPVLVATGMKRRQGSSADLNEVILNPLTHFSTLLGVNFVCGAFPSTKTAAEATTSRRTFERRRLQGLPKPVRRVAVDRYAATRSAALHVVPGRMRA